MDATTALAQTNDIMMGLIGGLTPDHREARTPCDNWNVHELIEHMVQGGQMIAGALQGQAPPTPAPDYLAEGPAKGWADAYAAMTAAATPEVLAATHRMPFGEVPGEVALSVVAADALTHAWDLAKATDQPIQVDDELAEWARATWQVVIPDGARAADGSAGFKPAVAVADGASELDKLIGFTGRQP